MTRYPTYDPWLDLWTGDVETADSHDVWRIQLDGRLCHTEADFFTAAASAFDFPGYFGHNWNAFDECLSDLLDITAGGIGSEFGDRAERPEHVVRLIVQHAEHLLRNSLPHAMYMLLNRLRDPRAQYFYPEPDHRYAELFVTFVCAAEDLDPFRQRLSAAGLRLGDVVPRE